MHGMNKAAITLLVAVITFGLTACDTSPDPEELSFGADYSVVVRDTLKPTVNGQMLNVRVAYSGCNGGHEFELNSDVRGNGSANVWLYKVTADQACDAYFEEDLQLRLPDRLAQGVDRLYLLRPANQPYTLWD